MTLLKTCLASIPIYLLSVIKFPRWAIDMINSHMGHFLWNNTEDHHKYHLASWQLVSQKKEMGGFGIPDLRSLNLALLSSWIFRYHLNTNSIWTRIVDYKYKTKNPIYFAVLMLDPHLFGRCDLGYTGCPYGYQVVSRKWGKNSVLGRPMVW